jgi:uncharacterized protein YegP (UPF0339 family)
MKIVGMLFKGINGDWYWRLLSYSNKKIIASSSEGYRRLSAAKQNMSVATGIKKADLPHVKRKAHYSEHLLYVREVSGEMRLFKRLLSTI